MLAGIKARILVWALDALIWNKIYAYFRCVIFINLFTRTFPRYDVYASF